jgi:glycosyltransferase involved in cell wall biosynthesis
VFTARGPPIPSTSLLNDNFRTLAQLGGYRPHRAIRRHARPRALRRKHGLDPDAVVVVNIGSVCERKGQHIYIRGLDLLRKDLPALSPAAKSSG